MANFEATHLKKTLLSGSTANGAGVSQNVADFTYGSVQVVGTFVADIQLQISNDGTTWADFGAVMAAPGFREVSLYSAELRAAVEGYVSGTVTSVTLIAKR